MAKISYSSAYFDESRLNAPFPFVAGFWADIDVWEFVDRDMRKAFEKKPASLSRKKYQRNDPVLFSKIFRKYCLQPIHASVEKKIIDNLIRAPEDWKSHPFMTDAYTTCSYLCCEKLDKRMSEIKLLHPAKIIFDKGTPRSSLLERGYRKYYSEKKPTYLEPSPAFDDEEQVMPLLAADLYAWLLAKQMNESLGSPEHEVNRSLLEIHKIDPLRQVVTEKAIRRIMGV